MKMDKLISFMARRAGDFASDESGATAIEYAMIAAGIAVAIIAAVNALGTSTKGMYTSVQTSLK